MSEHKKQNPYGVQVNQVWTSTDPRDNETRRIEKRFRVLEVHPVKGYAVVEPVARQKGHAARRQIRLDRFKPGSTGYQLYVEKKAHSTKAPHRKTHDEVRAEGSKFEQPKTEEVHEASETPTEEFQEIEVDSEEESHGSSASGVLHPDSP